MKNEAISDLFILGAVYTRLAWRTKTKRTMRSVRDRQITDWKPKKH